MRKLKTYILTLEPTRIFFFFLWTPRPFLYHFVFILHEIFPNPLESPWKKLQKHIKSSLELESLFCGHSKEYVKLKDLFQWFSETPYPDNQYTATVGCQYPVSILFFRICPYFRFRYAFVSFAGSFVRFFRLFVRFAFIVCSLFQSFRKFEVFVCIVLFVSSFVIPFWLASFDHFISFRQFFIPSIVYLFVRFVSFGSSVHFCCGC